MALVWFLPCMNKLVALKVLQQSELFTTFLTLVLFHTSVNQLMALQSVVTNECLATFIAFELL